MARFCSLIMVFGCVLVFAGGTLDWQNSGTFTTNPVVADGRVFIGADDAIKCFDLSTGTELWSAALADTTQSSPAVSDGRVVIGCNDGVFYCFEASNGHSLWSVAPSGFVPSNMGLSPTISEGKVFVAIDNTLFCFDLSDGSELWRKVAGDDFWGIGQNICSVYESEVFATNRDGWIYCLDMNTGETIWDFVTGDEIFCGPVVLPPYVYTGSDDSNFYCIDLETGEQVWSFVTGGRIVGTASVSEGHVFVPSSDGRIYKLNAITGESEGSFQAGARVYSPILSDGHVYISASDEIYCLDMEDLSEVWSFSREGAGGWSSMALSAGKLLCRDSANLYCLNAETSGQGNWPTIRHDALNSGNTDGPLVSSNSAPYSYPIPHVAESNWNSNIIAYNPTDSPITFYLNKWDDSGDQQIEEMEFSVPAKNSMVIDQGTLGYLGTAEVLSQSASLSVKLTYQYLGSESLCEFFIPRDTTGFSWMIPNSIKEWFDWFGLAIANHNNSSVSVTMDAYMDGTLVASTTEDIPALTKMVAVSNDIWTGIDYSDVDMVIITSSQPIAPPLSITGNSEQDRHVFFLGQKVE